MHLDEPLQREVSLETAAPRAVQHQCSAAEPLELLHVVVVVTGCVHEPASGHSPVPPTEPNPFCLVLRLPWYAWQQACMQ